MGVEAFVEPRFQKRQHIMHKRGAPRHPLKVGAPAVGVGPIQPRRREPFLEPAEECLMADVHAQRDVRLTAIATERALADQDAHDDAPLEVAQRRDL